MKYRLFVTLVIIFAGSYFVRGKSDTFVYKANGNEWSFNGDFYIYFSEKDPKMALRPSAISNVQYNVITWEASFVKKQILQITRKVEQAGDGFDDRILDGKVQERTADLFALTDKELIQPISMVRTNIGAEFIYNKNDKFEFKAKITKTSDFGFPELTYTLTPKVKGYFSVVYVGAPKINIESAEEIWQPLIWQEKRFPDMSYITAAFQCPVPTTFVQQNGYTLGVVAHPDEFPFQPLPLLENSRFAVALRTENGEAAPMIIAPVFGGVQSFMQVNKPFTFNSLLYVSKQNVTGAYEDIARNIYGFKDYRRNDICTLNKTFENIVEYSLSKYSWFIDEEKGCAYATDVPGAVKNVSSLNPLELAIVTDRKEMFEKRAYPIIEFMLSREKFLFCADSTQKIQSPSRKMAGPIAPVSEMSSLYNIMGKSMPFLLQLSNNEYGSERIRNLEVKAKGKTWQNALWIYKATGEKAMLNEAILGADQYLATRVNKRAEDFNDPQGDGCFFWTGFTPKWIDLLELYEVTLDKKYLDAAHDGARRYTMFTWMSPAIPTDSIVVNKDGKAPAYWYLMGKGHHQMYSPEEKAPAWRLSEIGLTPESSGTCSGHRAIFMANYAAWMLRIAYYTDDNFLREVAKAAVIGRYRNFPGYHINTARTTIYEKEDYPLKDHKDLSVNSFHYNHIMPHASLLLDYLVTDAWYRSKKAIDFPNEFIEGYAYLQSKLYGHAEGTFYGEKAVLWMPGNLLKTNSVELNYISARSDKKLMIAFTNQCGKNVAAEVLLNGEKMELIKGQKYKVRVIADNRKESTCWMIDGKFDLTVTANGMTSVIIENVVPKVNFQQLVLEKADAWSQDFYESKDGKVRAMLLNMGKASKTVYIYLTEDDNSIASASLISKFGTITDNVYPFEFSVPLDNKATMFEAEIILTDRHGGRRKIENIVLNEYANTSKN
ncbi:MAG: hypothetical protein GZ094_01690 [Mariniphaga sp.]|nr:hypothetical protein [Mariniphaga sp.]